MPLFSVVTLLNVMSENGKHLNVARIVRKTHCLVIKDSFVAAFLGDKNFLHFWEEVGIEIWIRRKKRTRKIQRLTEVCVVDV